MRATIAIVSLIVTSALCEAGQREPSLIVDLAALEPGVTRQFEIPSEQDAVVQLRHFAPWADYRITQASKRSRSTVMHDAQQLEEEIAAFRKGGDACTTALLTAVLAARSESEVALLLEGPSSADARRCASETVKKRLVKPTTVFVAAPEAGHVEHFTIERLRTDGTVDRSWSLRVVAKAPARHWAQPNEPSWLLYQTVRDIAEMSWFGTHRSPPSESLRLAIELGVSVQSGLVTVHWPGRTPLTRRVDLGQGLWNPRAFAGLAGEMIGPSRHASVRHSADAQLAALTDPRGETLQQANRAVSAALQSEPLDAQAHAEAALTLVALGLRESGGLFADPRHIQCRATAHLAMALALGGERSSRKSVLVAVAGLQALLGRQRESEQQLKTIEQLQPSRAEVAWVRALRLRNTGDWRTLEQPLPASVLERREYLRALRTRVSIERALDFYDSRNAERITDWAHVMLRGPVSVEAGNRFAGTLLPLEIEEASKVLGLSSGQPVGASLNRKPGRCVQPVAGGETKIAVLDDGAWGHYYQRRIAEAIVTQESHLRRRLAARAEAKVFWEQTRGLLRGTDVWPFLIEYQRQDGGAGWPGPEAREVEARLRSYWEQRPEAILPQRWRDSGGSLPRGDAWLRPDLVGGTTFFEVPRSRQNASRFDCPAQRRLFETAPYDAGIVEQYLMARYGPQYPGQSIACVQEPSARAATPRSMSEAFAQAMAFKPSLDLFQESYGALPEYDLAVMRARAAYFEDRPDEFQREFRKITDIDPDRWLELGLYFVRRGEDRAAADAYQRAVDEARDRVGVSNESYWLVDYYLDQGQADRAMKVARDSAATMSAVGLSTLARTLERVGDWPAAEGVWRRRDERYPRAPALPCFFDRREAQTGHGGLRAPSAALLGGPQGASLADFSGPPREGAEIVGSARLLTERGLRSGDVVVAIDGLRVRSVDDLLCLRSLRSGTTAKIIVWNGEKYLEVEGPFRRPHPAISFRQIGGVTR